MEHLYKVVLIGPVVSEQKSLEKNVSDNDDEGRRRPSNGNSSHGIWPGQL